MPKPNRTWVLAVSIFGKWSFLPQYGQMPHLSAAGRAARAHIDFCERQQLDYRPLAAVSFGRGRFVPMEKF